MVQVLGIDFGGTKILAGLVDPQTGEQSGDTKKKTHADRGTDAVLEQLTEAVQETLDGKGKDIQAVGIGVAGQIDAEKNILTRAPNLPEGLVGATIVDTVRKQVDVPVWLFNDVAAAAAGEAAFGAGAGHPDFVCVFVGTGIGGGVYRNGEPYGGATNTAGELGHMVIDFEGRICGCGGLGHLEAYASRSAIVRTILAAMKQGRQSTLAELVTDPDPEEAGSAPIRSKALKRALEDGDELVKEKLDEGAQFLAAGLASIVNFYNPPRIILGGGLVDAIDWFFDRTAAMVRATALSVPASDVEIVKASLGDYSGLVGAAVLASRHS
jgi:glucokinase